jgi:hypothetical protein
VHLRRLCGQVSDYGEVLEATALAVISTWPLRGLTKVAILNVLAKKVQSPSSGIIKVASYNDYDRTIARNISWRLRIIIVLL